jgi:metal-responsive CopG/Arc/MetJ family transcriptional regulator
MVRPKTPDLKPRASVSGISITGEVLARVDAQAKKEDRSRSNMITHIILEYYRILDGEKKTLHVCDGD